MTTKRRAQATLSGTIDKMPHFVDTGKHYPSFGAGLEGFRKGGLSTKSGTDPKLGLQPATPTLSDGKRGSGFDAGLGGFI